MDAFFASGNYGNPQAGQVWTDSVAASASARSSAALGPELAVDTSSTNPDPDMDGLTTSAETCYWDTATGALAGGLAGRDA